MIFFKFHWFSTKKCVKQIIWRITHRMNSLHCAHSCIFCTYCHFKILLLFFYYQHFFCSLYKYNYNYPIILLHTLFLKKTKQNMIVVALFVWNAYYYFTLNFKKKGGGVVEVFFVVTEIEREREHYVVFLYKLKSVWDGGLKIFYYYYYYYYYWFFYIFVIKTLVPSSCTCVIFF